MSKCPELEVQQTEFAMRRPTAYSQKRKFRLLMPISAYRLKQMGWMAPAPGTQVSMWWLLSTTSNRSYPS